MRKKTLVIKAYGSDRAYRKDAQKMSRKGYRVVDAHRENEGCGLLGCKGVFLLPIRKKPDLIVTYQLGG